jgi:acyl carrier protein
MDNVRNKLVRCFSLTFPNADPTRIPAATVDNLHGWDSIAQVRLLSLIGEEFGIEIDFEDFEGATSFEVLASRLSEIGERG